MFSVLHQPLFLLLTLPPDLKLVPAVYLPIPQSPSYLCLLCPCFPLAGLCLRCWYKLIRSFFRAHGLKVCFVSPLFPSALSPLSSTCRLTLSILHQLLFLHLPLPPGLKLVPAIYLPISQRPSYLYLFCPCFSLAGLCLPKKTLQTIPNRPLNPVAH